MSMFDRLSRAMVSLLWNTTSIVSANPMQCDCCAAASATPSCHVPRATVELASAAAAQAMSSANPPPADIPAAKKLSASAVPIPVPSPVVPSAQVVNDCAQRILDQMPDADANALEQAASKMHAQAKESIKKETQRLNGVRESLLKRGDKCEKELFDFIQIIETGSRRVFVARSRADLDTATIERMGKDALAAQGRSKADKEAADEVGKEAAALNAQQSRPRTIFQVISEHPWWTSASALGLAYGAHRIHKWMQNHNAIQSTQVPNINIQYSHPPYNPINTGVGYGSSSYRSVPFIATR